MNEIDSIQKILEDLKEDTAAENIKGRRKGQIVDLGLVNHFRLHNVLSNKWFDWERRVNAPIMIIGQDWGPYIALKKYFDAYEERKDVLGFNYDEFLFEGFSSRTEKFIFKAVQETYIQKYGIFNMKVWDNFFFTMSVLFSRKGKHFRGSHNFDPKQSTEISYPYVSRQISIVKPKIILTLGDMGFRVAERYFDLNSKKGRFKNKTLTQIINELGDKVIYSNYSNGNKVVIIPNFHPAAHVSPKLQIEIWGKVWKYFEQDLRK